MQLLWARQQLLHGRSQLIAVGKQLSPAKDVQPQPGPRQGHYQTPDIPDVPHCPGAHQGKQDVVVLLPLVLVHCGDLQATSIQADVILLHLVLVHCGDLQATSTQADARAQ